MAKKPRKKQEDLLHMAVWSEFEQRRAPGVIGWHTPNGGYRSKAQAADFKKMGVVSGVPDLQFIAPGPRLVFIELKAKKGRRSEEQEEMRQRLLNAGATWYQSNDLAEVVGIMRAERLIT